MADIKISQLGAAIAVSDSDLLPIVSSGSTLKASASQVKEYAVGDTDLTGLGDGTPTGAISALNTAKQPKTLATPITIGGTQQTTVEEALGGLNTESQSLRQALTTKVNTSDIANNLTTTASGKVLDASQGKALNDAMAFKVDSNGRIPQPSIDPNDITVTSVYNFSNKANLPDLGWWFVFTLVHANDSNYITQFALRMTDDWHEMCIRNKNNGVWNSWQSIATRGVYRTQSKEVTLTANASDWSYASVTWDTPFVYTPHVSVAISGASLVPEPVAITANTLTGAQVGMYSKSHNLKVLITATGWVKE